MNQINLGQKIIEFRKNEEFNSKELADITPSMLSHIEKIHSQSISTNVKTYFGTLNISLFNFFFEDTNIEKLVVRANQRKKNSFREWRCLV
ncbi:XRE family transcriptional regulator [Bacillus thuringiensis]|nr:XRE family transcriptional regulator [Bacillus thuringiensis]KIP22840.1 putative transcriptional regulator, MerR [Bacillus thuringiensis serovar morrisoni]MED2076427.1 XRE family transcriptional regulator [Bacillus thuringiensis]MEE2013022.1 XRE family transcriptional regulator [Bacillus thuringiensis]